VPCGGFPCFPQIGGAFGLLFRGSLGGGSLGVGVGSPQFDVWGLRCIGGQCGFFGGGWVFEISVVGWPGRFMRAVSVSFFVSKPSLERGMWACFVRVVHVVFRRRF